MLYFVPHRSYTTDVQPRSRSVPRALRKGCAQSTCCEGRHRERRMPTTAKRSNLSQLPVTRTSNIPYAAQHVPLCSSTRGHPPPFLSTSTKKPGETSQAKNLAHATGIKHPEARGDCLFRLPCRCCGSCICMHSCAFYLVLLCPPAEGGGEDAR